MTTVLAFLLAVSLAPARQDDPGSTVPEPAVAPAPGAHPFGEPLTVNGREITEMEIKRFLCYSKGRNALESRRLGLLMQQERELRVHQARQRLLEKELSAASGDVPAYEDLTLEQRARIDEAVAAELAYMTVPEEVYRARLEADAQDFHERFPTLDIDTEVERAYESVQWYEDQVRQTMEFDAMFFPGHPDGWPEITREAVHAGAPNVDLIEDYRVHYEERAAEAAEKGTPVPPDDEMMMGLLRDYVMGALASLVEIKSQQHGLPPEVLMTVEGGGFSAKLMTEDVYQEMKHVFNAHDVAQAKLLLALHEATRQRLSELGMLLSKEEFDKLIAGWMAQMEGSIFNWDFVALQGHQFPSIESYTENLYLLESYKRLIADQLVKGENGQLSEGMQKHLAFCNIVMGIGRCQAQVMLVSAFDFPRYRWKENGWSWAENEAFKVRAQIDEYLDQLAAQEAERKRVTDLGQNFEPEVQLLPFERWWSDKLDLVSEWWDAPLPAKGKMPPALGLKNKGRFQGEPMTRNDFKRAIGESTYYYLLANDSVTDKVFFDLEPGTVGGPYKGPWGYYLIYLQKRVPPSNPINMANEQQFNMVAEDYARQSFQEFAHESLAAAEVHGL